MNILRQIYLYKQKCCIFFILLVASVSCYAHGVDSNTEHFLTHNQGLAIAPFLYIGAKHMVTGYDHLLFLIGVIFFLTKPRDILIYVSLFTLGHSLTLLFGVFNQINLNSYLIDAVIAFSIIYKGFDNLGGFKHLFGVQPNTKIAVLIFGLFHGFGLATKLQDFSLPEENLIPNMLAFNVGVEIGQCLALLFILTLLTFWRKYKSYITFSTATNTLLMTGGWVLLGYQMMGYTLNT
jgi:hypothetical protein